MPKKFGTNTKKEEARERKEQVKKEKIESHMKEVENEYWKETDEKVLKKINKAKEKEEKKLEQLERKKATKELLEKEEEELENSNKKNANINKITQASAKQAKEDDLKRAQAKYEKEQSGPTVSVSKPEDIDVDEQYVNENFMKMEEYKDYILNGVDLIEGSGIDSIMNNLNITSEVNHPEKRMKAAWKAYVDKYYLDLKKQYPKYKRTKLLDMLSKDFHKSPENPMYVFKIQKQKEQLKLQLMNEHNK